MSAKSDAKAALLEAAHARSRTTSFSTLLVPNSLYGQVKGTQQTVAALVPLVYGSAAGGSGTKVVTKTTTVDQTISAIPQTMIPFQKSGRYFGITLQFAIGKNPDPTLKNTPSPVLTGEEKANWGTGFADNLVNPHKKCVYVVRATISQLGGDPPFGGYYLNWVSPSGWLRADGIGSHMWVEASSNPLLIARKFLSPSKITNQVFRVLVEGWYP